MAKNAVCEPAAVGLSPSFGFGDRIGLSTAGHIAALRAAGLEGVVIPVFAQQSIREMTRTGREPAEVLACASTAVEEAGWSRPWGADADHLKTEEDVRRTVQAGFTFFTADPSDYVDESAAEVSGSALETTFDAVCGNCQVDPGDFLERYARSQHKLSDLGLEIGIEEAMRVGLVYLPAVRHVVRLYEWVSRAWSGNGPFDFEVSVDETRAPTSAAAHYIVAGELIREGVRMTSLAPKFVGEFEKAVDYRGDPEAFEEGLKGHMAIARAVGPYKLSVHSGSDKFGIYPALARQAKDLLHVKTAGTSYLEALRLMARHRPAMFRDAVRLAGNEFAEARATYHLSTRVDRVPPPEAVADGELEAMFLEAPGADDARQVLHVAFGTILRHKEFGPALRELLTVHADEHAADLVRHFRRHLVAFGTGLKAGNLSG